MRARGALLALVGHLLAEALLYAPVQAPRPLASREPPLVNEPPFVDAVRRSLGPLGTRLVVSSRPSDGLVDACVEGRLC